MRVAFFGHKDTDLDKNKKILLKNMILKIVIKNTDVIFYMGDYGNFDVLCYSILKELKLRYPTIKTAFVTPYINCNYRKLKEAKDFYDEIIYPPIEKTPKKYAISKRNQWIIDNCDFLLCYVNKKYGGAYAAYKRAISKKIPLINLAE